MLLKGRLKGSYSRDVKSASAYIQLLPSTLFSTSFCLVLDGDKVQLLPSISLNSYQREKKNGSFCLVGFCCILLQPSLLDFSFKS